MTIEELIDRLPLITAAAFGVGALLVLVAMQFFRRSRRAPYWTQRRQAGQRGFRILLFSMFFFTVSALLCILTLANNYIEADEPTVVAQNVTDTPTPTITDTVESSPTFTEEPTVTDTATPTAEPTLEVTDTDEPSPQSETDAPQPSETPTDIPPTDTAPPPTATDVPPTETTVPPTATATDTATPEPTASATATPTNTPQPTSAVVIATVVGSQVPSSDASLSIINLSNRVSNDLRPTNEGTQFDAGFRRLYFMLEYDNMDSGVRWRRELYHNGVLVAGREDLWGNSASGQALFFVSMPGGFVGGDYEIRVLIEAEVADEASFTVN